MEINAFILQLAQIISERAFNVLFIQTMVKQYQDTLSNLVKSRKNANYSDNILVFTIFEYKKN